MSLTIFFRFSTPHFILTFVARIRWIGETTISFTEAQAVTELHIHITPLLICNQAIPQMKNRYQKVGASIACLNPETQTRRVRGQESGPRAQSVRAASINIQHVCIFRKKLMFLESRGDVANLETSNCPNGNVGDDDKNFCHPEKRVEIGPTIRVVKNEAHDGSHSRQDLKNCTPYPTPWNKSCVIYEDGSNDNTVQRTHRMRCRKRSP